MPTDYCVIDCETTGCAPERDRMVELAVVRIDSRYRELARWDTLLHPERPVALTPIHGITDAMVSEAPRFGDVLPGLARMLDGTVLVAHNFPFDRGFLVAELARAGVRFAGQGGGARSVRGAKPTAEAGPRLVRRMTSRNDTWAHRVQTADASPTGDPSRNRAHPRGGRQESDISITSREFAAVKGVCTVQLARRTGPAGSRSLAACCSLFGIKRNHAHAALDDVLATVELLRRLREAGVEPNETAPLALLERIPLFVLAQADHSLRPRRG